MQQFTPVHIIANPVSGNGRGARGMEQVIEYLKAKSIPFALHTTTRRGDAAQFAESIKNERPHIIIAGGDGTANETVNGLGIGSRARITLISAGSGNDLARALGTYKKSTSTVLDAAFSSEPAPMDIGEVAYSEENEPEAITRYFISSCGIGFDAYVSWISDKNNLLTGLPLYLSSVFRALSSYSRLEAEGEADGRAFSGDKLLITVGLTPTAGGGFRLTPEASINDGKLDLLTVQYIKPFRILGVLPKAIGGTHIKEPEVEYSQFCEGLLTLKQPYFCQADGEILSQKLTGARFKVHPKGLLATMLA